MINSAKVQRRQAHEQALASTRIEGHKPSAEFLADCEAVVEGSMTHDEARAASLRRALARDNAAVTVATRTTPDAQQSDAQGG